MIKSLRKQAILAIGLLLTLPSAQADARGQRQRGVSEILVNAANGSVLYAQSPDTRRRPASLTKMMTLYLAFDAIERGRLHLNDRLTFSRWAARQQPSKLGIPAGGTISVRAALQATAVLSANDVAVALAEELGGSEAQFARMMSRRAEALGMHETHFANATGLTDSGNVTSARDIATLSLALIRHHPREYALFSTRSFAWGSRRIANHNHLLGKVPGVDGIKTGYTADAGYNLAASAQRQGRRVVAVVLGESSIASRNVRAANLVELGLGAANRRVAAGGRASGSKHTT